MSCDKGENRTNMYTNTNRNTRTNIYIYIYSIYNGRTMQEAN